MKSQILKGDFNGLNKFVRSLNSKLVVKVGIFGNKAARNDESGKITNPELGAIHEFGSITRNIPARSFLRMPITDKAGKIVYLAGKNAKYFLARGDMKGLLIQLGIACEIVIDQAFNTGGFGKWKPNKPSTVKRKKGGDSPLIDTGQLRRSIVSKVE